MNKKQKITASLSTGIIIIAFVAYLLFTEKTLCKGVDISFSGKEDVRLIDRGSIEKIIFSEYENLIGSPVDNVNLEKLEKKIETLPSVKNAEVFKKINGILGVKIEQRKPLLRVFPENGKGFYIDEEGELMPLSKNGTVKVITVNGNIKYEYNGKNITVADTNITQTLKDIYNLVKLISKDDFLKTQTEQIYVTSNNEFELVPLAGNHTVLLGDMFDYENKMRHLKYFYTDVLNNEGWKNFSYINLKYKGQIVCTKNKE
ncbi:MAG: hypothetical protein GXO50_07500 [Chlorobi bacterium]|nr:hypothetical protein [Chlorobiota bacterium]